MNVSVSEAMISVDSSGNAIIPMCKGSCVKVNGATSVRRCEPPCSVLEPHQGYAEPASTCAQVDAVDLSEERYDRLVETLGLSTDKLEEGEKSELKA